MGGKVHWCTLCRGYCKQKLNMGNNLQPNGLPEEIIEDRALQRPSFEVVR